MKIHGWSYGIAALVLATGCQKRVAIHDAPAAPAEATPTQPATPQYAPPGVFYLISPVRKETNDGITRLPSGTGVKLVRPGIYLTPAGEMALDPKVLTNDMTLARAARDADAPPQLAASTQRPAPPAPTKIATTDALAQARAQNAQAVNAAAEKQRNLKFRLATLQREQSSIEDRMSYLKGIISQPGFRFRVSTAESDLNALTEKLGRIRAEIATLQEKIDAPP